MAVRETPLASFPPVPWKPLRRVAMLVVHSNPVAEPGVGDAGGMTVYVREMARSLAGRGVAVDIYTRRSDAEAPDEVILYPGVSVRQVSAGAPGIAKEDVAAYLPEFAANLLRDVERRGLTYDLLHSHYWLSGKVAAIMARRWRIPFVHTFHTLGRVKNEGRAVGDPVEPDSRLRGEARVIAEADAIVASTPEEREWLVDLYAAHPERIQVIAPGVDHEMFHPEGRGQAKALLARHLSEVLAPEGGHLPAGFEGRHLLLFVGRLQPLKGAGTAIEALAHLIAWGRVRRDEVALVIVGGSSGRGGMAEPERLRALAERLDVAEIVTFVPAQPHAQLPAFYRAADVCLVPSHTESFGLVALEAQSCGTPVVASAVGGLRSIVRHGQTGFLVQPSASEAFAERVWRVLSDGPLAGSMSRLAVCSSNDFSWDRSAAELCDLYVSSVRAVAEGDRNGASTSLLNGARRNLRAREEISAVDLDGRGSG